MTSNPGFFKNLIPEFHFPLKLNTSLFKKISSTRNSLDAFNFFDFGDNNKNETNENENFLNMENLLPEENRTILDSDIENFSDTDITESTTEYISTSLTDLIENTTNTFNDNILSINAPLFNTTSFEEAKIANNEQQSTTTIINIIKENVISTTPNTTLSKGTATHYITDQINNLKKLVKPFQTSSNGTNNELFPKQDIIKAASHDTLSIFLSVIIPVLIIFAFIMIYMWIKQRKKSFLLRHNISELYSIKTKNQENKGNDVDGMIGDQICSAIL